MAAPRSDLEIFRDHARHMSTDGDPAHHARWKALADEMDAWFAGELGETGTDFTEEEQSLLFV